MNGLDILLMSDWEIWITLVIIGGAGLTLVQVTPDFARPGRHGAKITMAAAAAMVAAAVIASYSVPPSHATASVVADAGGG